MSRYVVPEFDLGYRVNFNSGAQNVIPKLKTRRDICIVMKFPAIRKPGKTHKHIIFLVALAKDDMVYDKIKECEKKGYSAYLIRVYSNKKSKCPGFAPMFLPAKGDRPAYLKYTGLRACLDQIILEPLEEKYIIYFDSTRFVYALKDRNAYSLTFMQPLTIHPSRLVDGLLDDSSKILNETDMRLTFNTFHPIVSVKSIIEELPDEDDYILFAALGAYNATMRNELVLNTFMEFIYKYNDFIDKKVVLVFGGTYDFEDDFENYNNLKNTFYNFIQCPNVLVFFAQSLIPMETRAILKKALIMFDFSSSWHERQICKQALKYAVPLIVGLDTSTKAMIVEGVNGFIVDERNMEFNASVIRFALDEYQALSKNAYNYYATKYSQFACVLAEIEREENRIEVHNDID